MERKRTLRNQDNGEYTVNMDEPPPPIQTDKIIEPVVLEEVTQ